MNKHFSIEAKDALASLYVGKELRTGLDAYLIRDTSKFEKERPQAAREILRHCDQVENTVWNRKYDMHHNTFAQGSLVLYVRSVDDQAYLTGFMSGGGFFCPQQTWGIYYSDGMFLPEIRGFSLSSLAFALLFNVQVESTDSHRYLNLVISGNLRLFSFFERQSAFEKHLLPSAQSELGKILRQRMDDDFKGIRVDSEGIMRSAWREQNPFEDVWNVGRCKDYQFPVNVDYSQGDTLVRLYETTKQSALQIRQYVDSRLKNGEAK